MLLILVLAIKNSKNSDIHLLQGSKIKSLELHGSFMKDISQLKKFKISHLALISTKVRDINVIKELPLKELKIVNGVINDISAIEGTQIEELILEKCYFITDISPIIECSSLRKILIPSHITTIEFLAELPKLQVIAYNLTDYLNNQSAEEFLLKKWSKPILFISGICCICLLSTASLVKGSCPKLSRF